MQGQSEVSPFGQCLKMWRKRRAVSQLELAHLAGTTPRYVSFIETGRSRPGRELILRLAESLNVPIRGRNELLVAAGLGPTFEEHDLGEDELRPFRLAVEKIMEGHNPYPACASDGFGETKMVNPAFRALFPFSETMSVEEGIDSFFGPGPTREVIENWSEVAWAYIDARQVEARRSNHPRLIALTERALAHMNGVPRPKQSPSPGSPVISPRLRIGDEVIRTFTTVMRFEHAHEVTMSELRVELIFPMDEVAARFFRNLSATEGTH